MAAFEIRIVERHWRKAPMFDEATFRYLIKAFVGTEYAVQYAGRLLLVRATQHIICFLYACPPNRTASGAGLELSPPSITHQVSWPSYTFTNPSPLLCR